MDENVLSIVVAIVAVGAGIVAVLVTRKSRALAKTYDEATKEERLVLDQRPVATSFARSMT